MLNATVICLARIARFGRELNRNEFVLRPIERPHKTGAAQATFGCAPFAAMLVSTEISRLRIKIIAGMT
jgi:hypothetical protein